ncbi:MAG: peptide transporter, duplicated ATPase subunit [Holophagaceae bacterium]|nr:peptide transporter, duplicated ATPase subunit [Holophagaceae bacterium]
MWEPTSSDSALETEDLGVRRGQRWILRDLSLQVAPGEALGVIGESGAGKTTLALAILGLLPPSEGSIRMMGLPWSDMSEAQRRPHRPLLQAVFQDPMASLPPHRTGWEILKEPLAVQGPGDEHQRREMAQAMAERVKFPVEALGQRPHQWSGGLAQRLCLARALVLKPRILVLDEPLSALDPTLGSYLMSLLLDLKAEGLSLLFISHHMPAVSRICDRLLLIGPGRAAPG